MLAGLDPAVLERVSFPLGDQTKTETRAEAAQAGLAAAGRPESQEACFLGGDDYRAFLERRGLSPADGPIVDTAGRELGRHDGHWRFTPGQRRGLGVAAGEPLYALKTVARTNTVVVARRADLVTNTLVARGRLHVAVTYADAKLRYRSPAVPTRVTTTPRGFRLDLQQPAYAVARGQTASSTRTMSSWARALSRPRPRNIRGVILADYTASDFAWLALAAFLCLVGVGLFYALFRLGETLGQTTKTIEHTEAELLPVIRKGGETLDRVNRELDKVEVATDSALAAVQAADKTVRTVTGAITYPVQKLAGLIAGVRTGVSSFVSSRNLTTPWRRLERRQSSASKSWPTKSPPPTAASVGHNRRMRTSAELREGFLAFFEEKGHKRVPSEPLVPRAEDRTTLLISAGMQPMMPYFLGFETPPAPLLTTSQKSFRTVDIDEVGLDGHHLTLFEMLGNFSFGQYFKEGAIAYATEFVRDHMRLDWDRVWVTVHAGDPQLQLGPDEVAIELWKRIGMPPERIVPLPTVENFWAAGETGPCGPDSELYYDWGAEHGCGDPSCAPACPRCGRFLEFWNLVFMSYERHRDGTLTPLPAQNIDTGLGLERGAAILQDVMSVYDTDGYRPIMDWIAAESGIAYGDSPEATKAHRILADHGRGMTFLVADGVTPSNEGRATSCVASSGARSCRPGGSGSRMFWRLPAVVVEQMGDAYPELGREAADDRARDQGRGGAIRGDPCTGPRALRGAGRSARISAEDAFTLAATYGFPVELTVELAEERGQPVDVDGYRQFMEEHREISRGAAVESVRAIEGARTDFVGYEKTEVLTAIAALEPEGEGRFRAKLHESPFYAEGGGQVSDTGFIEHLETGARAELVSAMRADDDQTLLFEGEGFAVGDRVRAVVSWNHRFPTMANHTATHLLHRALREELGDHVDRPARQSARTSSASTSSTGRR